MTIFIGYTPFKVITKWSESPQLCRTLCKPMDYTVRGILQARILEWVTFPFSKGSSQPRHRAQVSCIAGGFFTSWATRKALISLCCAISPCCLFISYVLVCSSLSLFGGPHHAARWTSLTNEGICPPCTRSKES